MSKHYGVSLWNVISVMLLIGGTCIGGGMLAIPVSTGIIGFAPSLVMMLICWAFMTATGLLILEVSLWMDEGAHMITMVTRMLGRTGRVFAWVIYLFVCYASLIAYTSAGGTITCHLFDSSFGYQLAKPYASTIFIVVFGLVIYLGHYIVGRVNTVLFMGMLVAYFCLVATAGSEVSLDLLQRSDWNIKLSLMAVPLLLTSFSFQYIVPSLTPMLKSNSKWLRFSVIGGTTIALLFYIVWQWLVLGIVPLDGSHGLRAAFDAGDIASDPLCYAIGAPWVSNIAEYFALFALVTSFLGMALGLFDFLADGLSIKKKGIGNLILGLLVVIPTLFFAIKYSRAFLVALNTSGGFGDAILSGIIPVLMVWKGRYKKGWESEHSLFGGKPVLCLLFIFSIFSIVLECLELFYF